MKINLYDAFDNLDAHQAENISDSNMSFVAESDVVERIKKNVFDTLNITADKQKSKKIKLSSIKRFTALAAAIVVLLCATTAGAVVHFKPDSTFAQYLNLNETVDLSTMGQDVNIVSNSNGYEVKLKQIISDNSTMHLVFECPFKDGAMLVPWSVNNIKMNGHIYEESWGNSAEILDSNSFVLVFHDMRNIKNNDKITITFDRIENLYDETNAVDGEWEFEFNAIRANVKTSLEPTVASYKDVYGYEYKINKLTASPLGIYINYRQINGTSSDPVNDNYYELAQDGGANVTVKMKNGKVYSDNPDDCTLSVSTSGTALLGLPIRGTMGISFHEIIDVNEIESISVGVYEIYHS